VFFVDLRRVIALGNDPVGDQVDTVSGRKALLMLDCVDVPAVDLGADVPCNPTYWP
jgi:hypothetical protein